MKTNAIVIFLLAFISTASAKNFFDTLGDSVKFGAGLNCGITHQLTPSPNAYFGLYIPYSQQKTHIELNAGYEYLKYQTSFEYMKGFFLNSNGLYSELNFFLLNKLFFGIKYTYFLNIGNTNPSSESNLLIFSSNAKFLKFGYSQPINSKIDVRFNTEFGVNSYYKPYQYSTYPITRENKNDFIFRCILGFYYKF
jgi:hypothetical protein